MLKKGIIICSLLIMTLNLFGCLSKEDKMTGISGMSQSQRQEYIKNYLLETYGLNCSLTEIKKKQINILENEKDFSTVATTEDGFWFAIWITTNGQIKDTAFTYELKDSVNTYFEKIFEKNGIDCDVYDRFLFNEYPAKEWSKNEIEDMYQNENISDVIHIFTDQRVSKDKVKNALGDYKNFSLCDYNGAVCVHYATLDESEPDLESYDEFIDLD